MDTNLTKKIAVRAVPGRRTDIAYELICDRLTAGTYMPSEPINVAELVKTLNVSRQPIMAALQRLSSEELVQIIPQVGCVAAAYSHDEWHDFHRLFASGEALISEIATERGTDAEIRMLQQLSDDIKPLVALKLSPAENTKRFRQGNRIILEHIHMMARSPIIDRQLKPMWNRISYHYNSIMTRNLNVVPLAETIETHDEICDAMKNRDARKVASLTERHLLKQFGRSEILLDQSFELDGRR